MTRGKDSHLTQWFQCMQQRTQPWGLDAIVVGQGNARHVTSDVETRRSSTVRRVLLRIKQFLVLASACLQPFGHFHRHGN